MLVLVLALTLVLTLVLVLISALALKLNLKYGSSSVSFAVGLSSGFIISKFWRNDNVIGSAFGTALIIFMLLCSFQLKVPFGAPLPPPQVQKQFPPPTGPIPAGIDILDIDIGIDIDIDGFTLRRSNSCTPSGQLYSVGEPNNEKTLCV